MVCVRDDDFSYIILPLEWVISIDFYIERNQNGVVNKGFFF